MLSMVLKIKVCITGEEYGARGGESSRQRMGKGELRGGGSVQGGSRCRMACQLAACFGRLKP